MHPKFSVIVPVYNVEKYIAKCLYSLINQTLKEIEIICVDDASTDGSVEVIRNYMEKDNRISLLQHSQNKGLGATRNTGLKVVKSEFVTFVDSDDYLELDTYEKVIHNMTDDIDLLCFGIQTYGSTDEKIKKSDDKYYTIRYNGKTTVSNDVLFTTDVSSCNKIFRKSIIDKRNISYPEGLRYEDAYFFYAYSFWVKNIFFMPDKFYHYLRRDNSIMHETFGKKKGCSIDHTKIMMELYHYIKKNNLSNRWLSFFFDRFLCYIRSSLCHESSQPHLNQIYDLAIGFLKQENLWGKIPLGLGREYAMLSNRTLSNGKVYKCGGLIKIKEKPSQISYYLCGIPVLRIKYKGNRKRIYLFHMLLIYRTSKKLHKDVTKIFNKVVSGSYNNLSDDIFKNKTDFVKKKFLLPINYLGNRLDCLLKNYSIFQNQQNTKVDYALIWGSSSWEPQPEMVDFAVKNNIPVIRTEDAFLRSADTWCNTTIDKKYTDGISFTFSNDVHYFDATRPSLMERLINDRNLTFSKEQLKRAKDCIKFIVDNYLTKYNHQPIYTPKIGRDGVEKVLVIDQSYGDFSISKGLASDETFKKMLDTAIQENPDADIIIKTHPDALAAGSDRATGYYSEYKPHDNVYTFTTPINPISLLKYCDKVYVCTTQFGFEGLMCGKEVHTFGMPFYAGWGLTKDALVCERRTNTRTLEEIFYIAYIIYSHYVNPDTGSQCEIEEAMDYLLKLREEYFKEFNVRKDI